MSDCTKCIAFTELSVCPQKPNREDYEDENKYLIDLDCGVWNCQNAFRKLQEQIEEMKCCVNCSKYDRYNRMCSRTKFSVIETLCNCSDDWELRR